MNTIQKPLALSVLCALALIIGCGDDDDGRSSSSGGSGWQVFKQPNDAGKAEPQPKSDGLPSNLGGRITPAKASNDQLVGTWQMTLSLDESRLQQIAKQAIMAKTGKQPTAPQMTVVVGYLKKAFSGMSVTVTLKADGTSSSTTTTPVPPKFEQTQKQAENGKWEIVKRDGQVVKFKITPTDGQNKGQATEFTARFDDDNTFVITDASANEIKQIPGTMTFKRQ